jgi:hypothetical protein
MKMVITNAGFSSFVVYSVTLLDSNCEYLLTGVWGIWKIGVFMRM